MVRQLVVSRSSMSWVRSGIASLDPMDPVLMVHGTRLVSRLAVDSSLSEDHLRPIDSVLVPA